MPKKKILLIGQNGQVSTYLQKFLNGDYSVHVAGRSEIDLSMPATLAENLAAINADLIINPAAFTAVDLAEQERDAAFVINRDSVAVIADFCADTATPLIHFSTDYVFDGDANTAYVETDDTAPTGIYGQSKLEGEQAIVASGAAAIVLRTSWVYSNHGKNFYKTMLALSESRDELSVVADQIGSPTYAGSIARTCAQLAEAILEEPAIAQERSGIYHFSCGGSTSWCDFAKAIFAQNEKQVTVHGITTAEYPTPAQRPAFSVLDNGKLKQAFGLELPQWQQALSDCVKESQIA